MSSGPKTKPMQRTLSSEWLAFCQDEDEACPAANEDDDTFLSFRTSTVGEFHSQDKPVANVRLPRALQQRSAEKSHKEKAPASGTSGYGSDTHCLNVTELLERINVLRDERIREMFELRLERQRDDFSTLFGESPLPRDDQRDLDHHHQLYDDSPVASRVKNFSPREKVTKSQAGGIKQNEEELNACLQSDSDDISLQTFSDIPIVDTDAEEDPHVGTGITSERKEVDEAPRSPGVAESKASTEAPRYSQKAPFLRDSRPQQAQPHCFSNCSGQVPNPWRPSLFSRRQRDAQITPGSREAPGKASTKESPEQKPRVIHFPEYMHPFLREHPEQRAGSSHLGTCESRECFGSQQQKQRALSALREDIREPGGSGHVTTGGCPANTRHSAPQRALRPRHQQDSAHSAIQSTTGYARRETGLSQHDFVQHVIESSHTDGTQNPDIHTALSQAPGCEFPAPVAPCNRPNSTSQLCPTTPCFQPAAADTVFHRPQSVPSCWQNKPSLGEVSKYAFQTTQTCDTALASQYLPPPPVLLSNGRYYVSAGSWNPALTTSGFVMQPRTNFDGFQRHWLPPPVLPAQKPSSGFVSHVVMPPPPPLPQLRYQNVVEFPANPNSAVASPRAPVFSTQNSSHAVHQPQGNFQQPQSTRFGQPPYPFQPSVNNTVQRRPLPEALQTSPCGLPNTQQASEQHQQMPYSAAPQLETQNHFQLASDGCAPPQQAHPGYAMQGSVSHPNAPTSPMRCGAQSSPELPPFPQALATFSVPYLPNPSQPRRFNVPQTTFPAASRFSGPVFTGPQSHGANNCGEPTANPGSVFSPSLTYAEAVRAREKRAQGKSLAPAQTAHVTDGARPFSFTIQGFPPGHPHEAIQELLTQFLGLTDIRCADMPKSTLVVANANSLILREQVVSCLHGSSIDGKQMLMVKLGPR